MQSEMLPAKLVIAGKQKQGMDFRLPRLDKTDWAIYTTEKYHEA
jgi:hypothetical protein